MWITAAWAVDALVVVTPGFEVEAFAPLIHALVDEGAQVQLVSFPCVGDAAAHVATLRRAAARQAPGYVVVAHGLGATLALQAAPELEASQLVLLGPVVGASAVASTAFLSEQAVGASVDLSQPLAWRGRALHEVVLGRAPLALGCVSGSFAREVQGWWRMGEVPVALSEVPMPVWLGLGLRDVISPPEVTVPLSRALPQRELVRLGITHLDPVDYDHSTLLVDPVPCKAAARAAVGR